MGLEWARETGSDAALALLCGAVKPQRERVAFIFLTSPCPETASSLAHSLAAGSERISMRFSSPRVKNSVRGFALPHEIEHGLGGNRERLVFAPDDVDGAADAGRGERDGGEFGVLELEQR